MRSPFQLLGSFYRLLFSSSHSVRQAIQDFAYLPLAIAQILSENFQNSTLNCICSIFYLSIFLNLPSTLLTPLVKKFHQNLQFQSFSLSCKKRIVRLTLLLYLVFATFILTFFINVLFFFIFFVLCHPWHFLVWFNFCLCQRFS